MTDESNSTGSRIRYWTWWMPVFAILWAASLFYFAKEPVALVESNWYFIIVGFCAAVIGNISALGGGIVFIPVMIFLFHLPPVAALKIAIASQCFGMTSGAVSWIEKKIVPLQALVYTVPGLLIGSTISSLLIHPNALLVKLLFGPVSIVLGVTTLILASRARGTGLREVPKHAMIPVFIASLIGGMLTGWVAIGEGEVVAALLMLFYGMDIAACIGLGCVLLAINSVYLTFIHQFALGGIPWDIAAFTVLGTVFGARFSPWIAHRLPHVGLKKVFAFIAIGDGILFIAQYILMNH